MGPWAVALPNLAMIAEVEADRATVSPIKQVDLKLAAVPSEALHTLLDGVIAEIRAWEQRALNVISE